MLLDVVVMRGDNTNLMVMICVELNRIKLQSKYKIFDRAVYESCSPLIPPGKSSAVMMDFIRNLSTAFLCDVRGRG